MNDIVPTRIDSLMATIENLAKSDADPAKMQAFIDMYNAERDRQQRAEFSRDLNALQSECFEIQQSGFNPTFKRAYPNLNDLVRQSRPYCSKHNITIRFGTDLHRPDAPAVPEKWQRVVIIIEHTSGYWEEHHMDGPPDLSSGRVPRSPIQSVGSTNTYLRRYLLQMALNLIPEGAPEDNDGEPMRQDVPVTPEQVKELVQLLNDCGMSDNEASSLLKRYGATTLAEVRSGDFEQFANTLIGRKKLRDENNGQN